MRNSILTASLIFLLFSAPATARKYNFAKSIISFGFTGGLDVAQPKSNAAENNSYVSGNFGYEYGGELGINFINKVLIRPTFSLILPQEIGSKGNRSTDGQYYTQTTEAKLYLLGGKLSFITWMSSSAMSMFYFGGGIDSAKIKLIRNRRHPAENREIQEHSIGKTTAINGHIGFATFMAQNWSFGLELGYRNLNFSKLSFDSSNDVNDQPVASGSTAINDQDSNLHFNYSGVYGQAIIKINF